MPVTLVNSLPRLLISTEPFLHLASDVVAFPLFTDVSSKVQAASRINLRRTELTNNNKKETKIYSRNN